MFLPRCAHFDAVYCKADTIKMHDYVTIFLIVSAFTIEAL